MVDSTKPEADTYTVSRSDTSSEIDILTELIAAYEELIADGEIDDD